MYQKADAPLPRDTAVPRIDLSCSVQSNKTFLMRRSIPVPWRRWFTQSMLAVLVISLATWHFARDDLALDMSGRSGLLKSLPNDDADAERDAPEGEPLKASVFQNPN